MSDQRMITEFFQQEAPEIKLPDNWASLNSATVLPMYHFMCDLLFGIGDFTDSNGQPTRAACVVKLHKILCGLFGDILPNEGTFGYRDLLLPDPGRTRYFLVNLIRFYHFKCERQADVENVISELEERRRDVENEKAFEQNILKQIESEQSNLDKLQEKRRELDGKSYALERELADLRVSNDSRKTDFEKMELYAEELQEKITTMQQDINEASDKSKRLDSDIVTSPDRFTKELESNEAELNSVIAKKDDFVKELRKLERDFKDQTQAMQFLEHCSANLTELLDAQAIVTDARRVTDDAQRAAKEVELSARQATQKAADQRMHNEAHIRNLLDKTESLKRNVDVIRKEMMNLENDVKSLNDLKRDSEDELRNVLNEIKKRHAEIAALGERFDVDVAKLRDAETKLTRKTNEEEAILKKVYQKARILLNLNTTSSENNQKLTDAV